MTPYLTLLPLLLPLTLSKLSVSEAKACERTDEFKASVIIEHDGDSLDTISDTELTNLGMAFAQSYNHANNPEGDHEYCDPDARYVKTVLVEPKHDPRLARRDYIYTITGVCNNACESYNLFHDPADMRRDLGLWTQPSVTTSCTCPDTGEEKRTPTEDEFMLKFQEYITTMGMKGYLGHVTTVNAVVEVNTFPCSDQDFEEIDDMIVDLSKVPIEADKPALEIGLVDAYNALTKYFCDDTNAILLESTMSLEEVPDGARGLRTSRRLGKRLFRNKKTKKESGGGDDTSGRKLQVTYTVLVTDSTGKQTRYTGVSDEQLKKFEYYGMKYEIIDSSDGSISAETTKTTKTGVTYNADCYCPVRPMAVRPPNADEILESYNLVLKYENREGITEKKYEALHIDDLGPE